jgi:hypothetical protein
MERKSIEMLAAAKTGPAEYAAGEINAGPVQIADRFVREKVAKCGLPRVGASRQRNRGSFSDVNRSISNDVLLLVSQIPVRAAWRNRRLNRLD